MSLKLLGIDVIGRAPSSTPTNELGIKVLDIRGGEGDIIQTYYPNGNGNTETVRKKFAPGAEYMYVKFLGTVSAGDACKMDVTAAAAIRDATAIRTTALLDVLQGIAVQAATTGQYGWVQYKGRFYDANVADASAAGEILGPGGTAGRLVTLTPSAANALAAAASNGVPVALIDASGDNLADIDLR